MKKIRKEIIMGLGVATLTLTPALISISCGSSNQNPKNDLDQNKLNSITSK